VPVVNGMTARIVMWARCWDRSGIHSTAFPGRAGRRRAGKKPGHSAQDDVIYDVELEGEERTDRNVCATERLFAGEGIESSLSELLFCAGHSSRTLDGEEAA